MQILKFTFFYILPFRIIFKQSLQMFHFTNELLFSAFTKLARIIILVIQIKCYTFLNNSQLFFFCLAFNPHFIKNLKLFK